jgi:hypothetical protein
MRNIVTVARVEPSMARRRQKDRALSSHEWGKQNTTSARVGNVVYLCWLCRVCVECAAASPEHRDRQRQRERTVSGQRIAMV